MITATPIGPVVEETAQSVPLHMVQLPRPSRPSHSKLSGSSSQRVSSLKEPPLGSYRGRGEGMDDLVNVSGRRPSSQKSLDMARSSTQSALGERVTPIPRPPLHPFDALAQVG